MEGYILIDEVNLTNSINSNCSRATEYHEDLDSDI